MPKMSYRLSNSIIQLPMAATRWAVNRIMAGNSTEFCCTLFKFTFSLGIHIDEMYCWLNALNITYSTFINYAP